MAFANLRSAYQGTLTNGAYNDRNGLSAAWRVYAVQFKNEAIVAHVADVCEQLDIEWTAHLKRKRKERTGRFDGSYTVANPIRSWHITNYSNILTGEAAKREFNALNNNITDCADEFDINRVLLANIIAGDIRFNRSIRQDKVKADILTILGGTEFIELPPKYRAASTNRGWEIGPGGSQKEGKKFKKGGKRFKKGRPY